MRESGNTPPNTAEKPPATMTDNAEIRKQLIEHLSGEINNNDAFIHALRTKLAFTVLLGPFLVLGSYVIGTNPSDLNFCPGTLEYYGGLLAVIYVILGIYAALMEKIIQNRSNQLRRLILRATENESGKIKWEDRANKVERSLGKTLKWFGFRRLPKEAQLRAPANPAVAYVIGYLLVFAAFALVVKFLEANQLPC